MLDGTNIDRQLNTAGGRREEVKTAFQIRRSEKPVMIIGEDRAKHMAQIGFYIASVMPYTPIVFDTPKAKKEFYKVAGDLRGYYQTVEVTKDQARGADFVMVFGDNVQPIDNVPFIKQPRAEKHFHPPRINFALIDHIMQKTQKHFSRTWVDQCRTIKPASF